MRIHFVNVFTGYIYEFLKFMPFDSKIYITLTRLTNKPNIRGCILKNDYKI